MASVALRIILTLMSLIFQLSGSHSLLERHLNRRVHHAPCLHKKYGKVVHDRLEVLI